MQTDRQLAPSHPPLRVLTYNVHSCRGRDGRHDPARIADVIASTNPHVIALQELDVGRLRTGGVDQADLIARHLKMDAHFHPALHVDEEKYGDAIITALPSRIIKAAALPSIGEPRGAIWVELDYLGQKFQLINTHFGLRRREREIQAQALVGDDWLVGANNNSLPVIVAGDFNSIPRSAAFRTISNSLDGPRSAPAKPTFPSWFPVLRLDHIFTNRNARITGYETIDTPLARLASDHLPLIALVDF